jgi:hypothetical protein
MQTTTNPEVNIPTSVLITICILLVPCAVSSFFLLAGPPEWREPTWHVLHTYTAIMLGFLGGLYGAQLWKAKPMGKTKSPTYRRSTMWLSLGSTLLACISLTLPAVIGVGVLLLSFAGFKTALARQGEVSVRLPQWYGQLGDQFAAWVMIFLGIALATILL